MTQPEHAKKTGIWVSGPWADRAGDYRYVHLVRSADDPPQQTRKQRGCQPLKWKLDFNPDTKPMWKEAIYELLGDGKPRTFNHIIVELTHSFHTADVAFERAPDWALWELVSEWKVSHTREAPILFRRSK